MIVFDLECRAGAHRFEGWFASSGDFVRQQERGLVTCPHCGSPEVGKAIMAPRVTRKGNQLPEPIKPQKLRRRPETATPVATGSMPPEAMALMHKLATMQAEALKTSRFVGENFAEDARAMHYGEVEAATIHGQATAAQAEELLDEGVMVAPLLFPVVPPEQAN